MGKLKPEDIRVLDEVPPLLLPFAQIVSPKPGVPVKCIILNSQPVQVYTHYWQGRTIPCRCDRALCDGCQNCRKRTYKGYFGAWYPTAEQFCLAEYTHFAAERFRGILKPHVRDFRGAEIQVVRLGRAVSSRCKMSFEFGKFDSAKLPPPLPVLEILLQIWGGESVKKRVSDGMAVNQLDDVPT